MPNHRKIQNCQLTSLKLRVLLRPGCLGLSTVNILCYILYYIPYYIILYYTILYYTILYYTILYYTILYDTILYYTILYFTILYYIITLARSPLCAKGYLRSRAWASLLLCTRPAQLCPNRSPSRRRRNSSDPQCSRGSEGLAQGLLERWGWVMLRNYLASASIPASTN